MTIRIDRDLTTLSRAKEARQAASEFLHMYTDNDIARKVCDALSEDRGLDLYGYSFTLRCGYVSAAAYNPLTIVFKFIAEGMYDIYTGYIGFLTNGAGEYDVDKSDLPPLKRYTLE